MKKRLVYIDLLKIIAIFLVVYNHTMGFINFTSANIHSKRIWFYIYTSIITKINVPIFMMASGALLLKKEISIKTSIKKALKFFSIFLIISIVLFIIKNNGNFVINDFLTSFMNCKIDPSYWYMYAYVGFLLFLPYIRKIASDFETKDLIYFSIFYCLIHTLIPTINYFSAGNISFRVPQHLYIPLITVQIYFYAIVGHYLANVVNLKNISLKKINCAIVMPAFIFAVIPTYFTYKTGIKSGFNQQYFEYANFFMSIAIFILFKKLFENYNSEKRSSKFISRIGSLTLGIYLFEPIAKHYLYKHVFNISAHITNSMIFISVIWCIFAMITCGLFTIILKKIPVINKLI